MRVHKYITEAIIVAALLLAFRQGFFKGFPRFLGLASWKSYLQFLSGLCGLVVLLMPLDSALLKIVQKQDAVWAIPMASFGTFLSHHTWKILGWAYVTISFTPWKRIPLHLFSALFASIVSALLTMAFKFTFLRARPYANAGPFSFFNLDGILQDSRVYQSFTSGDTAIVAGAAGYFFLLTKNKVLRWLWLLPPLATAFERMSENKHWPSDTALSIGLGFLVAFLVWDFKKFRNSEAELPALSSKEGLTGELAPPPG